MTFIKLSSNENPFGPSPRALEAMQSAIATSNIYPDSEAQELTQLLAQRHQVPTDQLLITAGLTSLLDLLARSLLSPELNAVTSQRSFIVYGVATRAAGGHLIETPMRDNGFDLDAVAAAIDGKTRIVFVANPNNPTGTILSAAELDRFVERLPEHVLLVLDEAYYDFARHFAQMRGVDYSHSLDYVRRGRNVVVLRTFSKAHGLAALRIGYGMGPARLMSQLGRLRPTFSISDVAQAAAIAALGDQAHILKVLENNAEQAEWLTQQISELGIHLAPTWGNFLYLELGEDSIEVANRMKAEGVMIRPMTPWGAPTAIRVTIGTPDQNQIFLRAFKKVAGKRELAKS